MVLSPFEKYNPIMESLPHTLISHESSDVVGGIFVSTSLLLMSSENGEWHSEYNHSKDNRLKNWP